ncbi:MAG: nucleotidyltransferase domain-containing protein [Bacteroidales bacterium]|nr:nucleotidyltransferase domain-containing protein [Bacteroidota bacterium]MBL6950287.1 nucleotidyltransferase domain-containing protein [Bacteroidales bacterium]
MREKINDIKESIKPILSKYGIRNAFIVGSVARGEDTIQSDIDIVVEIDQPLSLLTFARIKIELEEILHKKVDLIERSAIKPRLKKYLLENEILIS